MNSVINKYYISSEYLPQEGKISSIKSKINNRHKILVIAELLGEIPSPCSYIRLLNPLLSPVIEEHFDIRFSTLQFAKNIPAEVVIINRVPCEKLSQIEAFLLHIKREKIKLVYDIDDQLLKLHDNHPEIAYYKDRQPVVSKLLRESDVVWTSTIALADALRPHSKKIIILENYLDPSEFSISNSLRLQKHYADDVFKILYMGTTSHIADLDIVLDALRLLQSEGIKIKLYLIGVCKQAANEKWIKVLYQPYSATIYPLFMSWLRSLPKFDLGIAPLEVNDFNSCKSAMKFWDYTSLGIPTLASNIESYNKIILDGKSGFLAENTTTDWYNKIKNAIINKEKLYKIIETAKKSVTSLYKNIDGIENRKESLFELLDLKYKETKKKS